MSFEDAVKNTPSIARCFKSGLQALGGYSSLIRPPDPRQCSGSIEIDQCTRATDQQASRWDYALGYKSRAYFVEVHPANGSVTDVVKKAEWLREWLKSEGHLLAAIHGDGVFHWLPTGKVKIFGQYEKLLAQHKILVKKLELL
jgi:hypothetical protein